MDPHTPPAEWERDTARANAELQRSTISCEVGEEAHRRIENVRREHVCGRLVVACRYDVIKVVLHSSTQMPSCPLVIPCLLFAVPFCLQRPRALLRRPRSWIDFSTL